MRDKKVFVNCYFGDEAVVMQGVVKIWAWGWLVLEDVYFGRDLNSKVDGRVYLNSKKINFVQVIE